MKAALLRAAGRPLEPVELQVDRPWSREVLVRTAAAGVCHTDLHATQGRLGVPVPTVLGHEATGVVEAVGGEVRYVRPGDTVVLCLSVFCGQCEYCLTGRMAICEQSPGLRPPGSAPRLTADGGPVEQFLNVSAFAEQMLVHENALVKVDPDLPPATAALLGCAVMTGLGAVFNTARVTPGSTVAVIGCGGVGLNAVQGAVVAGAARVIAVDIHHAKLDLARRFGATDVVAGGDGAVAGVRELSGGGVDHAFEAIGTPATCEQAFAMLRKGGTATIIGLLPPDATLTLPASEFLREKRIQGCDMGSNRFRVDVPRYVQLYRQGRLILDELVSAEIRLDQLDDAFAAMEAGETTRSVVRFET